MNEVVKIHNDLTNQKLGKMNAKELDLFMSICYKMRDKGCCEVVIGFDELRKLGSYNENSNERMKQILLNANAKMFSFIIQIDQGSVTEQKTLFKKFRTDSKNATVTVEVWEELAYILNDIVKNFTRFELSDFIDLKSKYAKRLFKLLKQYRTQGKYYTSKDDFYKELNVPETYTNTNFNKKVLRPAIKECRKKITGLECIPKKSGRGGAIQGYTFTFDREIPVTQKDNRKTTKNSFNEFEQNEYDIEFIEENFLSN